MNRSLKLFILLLILCILTGCWDKLEIEERAYVSVLGIDLNTEAKSPREKYLVTYSWPNLNAIGKNASSEKTKFVLSSTGRSIYDTSVEMATRINKTLFLKHIKVIVIGEDVARNPDEMKAMLDGFGRSSMISRKAVILIAEGMAKDAINIENEMEPVTGALIEGIWNNYGNTARFNHQNLGHILTLLYNIDRALLPRVVPKKDGIIVAGSSIIKDFKHIAWLGELETRAIMFMKGMVESEMIDITLDGIEIPYIVSSTNVKKSANAEGGKINMNYFIQLEGYTQRFKLDIPEKIMDSKTINKIEKQVEKTLEDEINVTVNKIQKNFNVDVIEVEEYLRKFKPDVWEKIKDDWEEIFQDISITVKVEAKLRRVGMTK